jgi:hypothetical protein
MALVAAAVMVVAAAVMVVVAAAVMVAARELLIAGEHSFWLLCCCALARIHKSVCPHKHDQRMLGHVLDLYPIALVAGRIDSSLAVQKFLKPIQSQRLHRRTSIELDVSITVPFTECRPFATLKRVLLANL